MRLSAIALPMILALGGLPCLVAEETAPPAAPAATAAATGNQAEATRLLTPFHGRWAVTSGKMTSPSGETQDMPPGTNLVFAFADAQLTVTNPGGREEVAALDHVAAAGGFVTCEMHPANGGGDDVVLKIRLQRTDGGVKLEAEESKTGGKIVLEMAAEATAAGSATAAGPATPATP